MIKSYNEEINSQRNRNAIFWFVVFIVSGLLYLFFQGYYINIDFKSASNSKSPTKLLKQFGIINLKVFPNPDNIFINGKPYGNGNKSIFDYGNYNVEIYSKDYIPVQFMIEISKNYPIFYETINIFKKFQYKPMSLDYDSIKKVDDFYFAFTKKESEIYVLNSQFKLAKVLTNPYTYIGYKYFSNNGQILIYDFENNIQKPFVNKGSTLGEICRNARIFHDRLFCFDNMDFIDGSTMKGEEEVARINNNIILTKTNIYNNGNGGDWGTYAHSNKFIYDPDNLVHIESMPYILEDGFLYNLENVKKTRIILPELDMIKNAYEFSKETLLLGYKGDVGTFMLIDEKHKFTGSLKEVDLSKVTVTKLNGAYLFNTGTNLYIYYKGSDKLTSILKGENISIIENTVFFRKDGKNFYMNLIQE